MVDDDQYGAVWWFPKMRFLLQNWSSLMGKHIVRRGATILENPHLFSNVCRSSEEMSVHWTSSQFLVIASSGLNLIGV